VDEPPPVDDAAAPLKRVGCGMQRALIVAAALLGCGGSQKSPPTTPSNSTDPARHDDTMDEEVVEGERPANEQQLARKQAIEQARAAGILGGRGPDPQPTGALDKASIRAAVRASTSNSPGLADDAKRAARFTGSPRTA